MTTGNMKNDVIVKGAGLEYTLRPSFGCLMAIEQRAKKSILKIIEEFTEGHGLLNDMIIILKEGSRASGNAMTDREIESLVEQEGVMAVQVQLANFFAKGLYGGKIHEGLSNPKTEAEGQQDPMQSIGMTSSESQSVN